MTIAVGPRCKTRRVFELLIVLVSAALAGAGAWAAGAALRMGPRRRTGAVISAALFAAAISSEIAVDAVGNFWATHPASAAALIGVLLLALTALVVEAAAERLIERAQEARWRSAGKAACEAVLVATARAHEHVSSAVIWNIPLALMHAPGRPGMELTRVSHRPEQIPDMTSYLDAMRAPILTVAPVLTATPSLHAVYGHALSALQATADLVGQFEDWKKDYGHYVNAPASVSDGARMAFWGAVVPFYDTVGLHLHAFHVHARKTVGADLYDAHDPPWRRPEPVWFAQGRASYQAQFGGGLSRPEPEREGTCPAVAHDR